MKKNILKIALLLAIMPAISNCVPTQDITNLDLRIRNLDNKVVKLTEAVDKIGINEEGSPLETMRDKQAEMSDTLDRLNMEILQVKGQLEESSHFYRNLQQDNDKMQADLQLKISDLSDQFVLLTDQLNQTSESINAVQKSNMAALNQAKAAEARAIAAEQEAAEAKKAQEELARKNAKKGPKEILPTQSKLTPQEKKTQKSKVITGDSGSSKGPGKEIYDKALGLFRSGKFNDAYREFADYIEKHPNGKMAPNARFWLGDCYYNQQEYELAILEYQKVIANFTNHPKAPAALLKQGLAFEKLKDNDTAVIVYKKLLAEYAKSEQAQTARKRIKSLK